MNIKTLNAMEGQKTGKYYNKLSDEYDHLYYKLITDFQKRLEERNRSDEYYVDFYPSLGIRQGESAEFLVCGQAVNGWESGFTVSNVIGMEKISESILASNASLDIKNHTPLDWVNVQWSGSVYNRLCSEDCVRKFYNSSYKAYRSFFWNVTYKLICDFYGIPRSSFEWSKKLVWSNLYKLVPYGANPGPDEREFQHPWALELVRKELEEINPKYCIVQTGLNWWEPFRKHISSKNLDPDKSLDEVAGIEQYGNTKILILNRPRVGKSEKFVEQILRVLRG